MSSFILGALAGTYLCHRLWGVAKTVKFVLSAAIAGAVWSWRTWWDWRRPSTTYGSARWANHKEIERVSAPGSADVVLGKLDGKFIRNDGREGSTLVFAPMGQGKGVGVVIPTLLGYRGSVVVTDPKGENFRRTRRRRAEFGRVHCINLIDPEASDGINPLDYINLGSGHEEDDAAVLADLLLVPDSSADSHWREKAKSWLTGILLYVAQMRGVNPAWANMGVVNELVCGGKSQLLQMGMLMTTSPVPKIRHTGNEMVRSLEATEEGWNILSNIEKGTRQWGFGTPMGKIGRQSTFRLQDVVSDVMSLYLVVPEEKLAIYGPVLRVIVGLALHRVTEQGKTVVPAIPPLFMLDECAALGYLEPLETGMGHMRAYARVVMVFQDLHQLKAVYRKAESMMANCAAIVGWAVNDMDTARMLAERVGMATVRARSMGVSKASDVLVRHQSSAGLSETGRQLIDPSEVVRLASTKVIGFVRRGFPVLADRVTYYEEPCFAGQWDEWRDGATEIPWKFAGGSETGAATGSIAAERPRRLADFARQPRPLPQ